MSVIYKFLFPSKPDGTAMSLLILALRILFGVFPMIFTMCIAFFVVHGSDPFAVKELAFIYLVVFILLYIAGPGKFSLDHFIAKALASHKK